MCKHLLVAKASYKQEQQVLAVAAKKRGDFAQAVTHYQSLKDIESQSTFDLLQKAAEPWPPLFPVSSLFMPVTSPPRAQEREKAIYASLLVDAKRRMGDTLGARLELEQAAALLTGASTDTNAVHQLITAMAPVEDSLLRWSSPAMEE
jgi:hypothetical protein